MFDFDGGLTALVLAQLVILPVLTAVAALLVRRHPARAHTVMIAGLLATLAAPLLSVLAAVAGLGFLPGLELVPGGTTAVAADAGDDAARLAPVLGPAAFLVIGWALASGVLLVRLLAGLRWGFRIARDAGPCEDEAAVGVLRRVADGAVRRASVRPTLHCTERLASPVIFCWGRAPRILLPTALVSEADRSTLEQILTHELAHLARCDHWWRLVAELAVCLVPWHPLVWWLRRAVYETSEMACDARVLRGEEHPERYAATLLRLTPCRSAALPALHAVRSSSRLTRRIRAILGPARPRDRSGAVTLALTVVGATAVTAGAALAQRRPILITPGTVAPARVFAVQALPNETDLGLVAPGATAAGFIRLVNVGAKPITVSGHKAACGCTTVESVEGRTIAPGAVLKVPITLAAPDTTDTEHQRMVTFFFQELDPLQTYVRLRTTP